MDDSVNLGIFSLFIREPLFIHFFFRFKFLLQVLGVIRVPLLVMHDKGGFPAFIRNNFVENCKDQLLTGLSVRNILDEETLQLYLKLSLCSDALSTCGAMTRILKN